MEGIKRLHIRLAEFLIDNGGEQVKGHCMTCDHAHKSLKGELCCFVRPNMIHGVPKSGYCHEWSKR